MTRQQEFRKQTEEAKFEAFSLMCEKVAELEKENADLKEINAILSESSVIKQKDLEYKVSVIKQRNKRIEELEKENAELKAKNKWYSEQVCNKECAEVWGNLTKAKDIIKSLLSCCRNYPQENAEKVKQAEQFLKE